MTQSIAALNPARHGKLHVVTQRDFSHASEDQLVPVVVQECVDAATEFPLVFVKNAQTGEFTLVAMMGLQPQQNLYCGQGDIQANYVPQVLRLHPFSLRPSEQAEQLMLCIDEQSNCVSEEHGQALFDEQGNKTAFLQAQSDACMQFIEHQQITRQFAQLLLQHNLLTAQRLTIRLGDEQPRTIDGVYIIDQKRLSELDAETLATLNRNGALQVIHAQLLSLKQLNRLSKRASQR
ncbi:SapC family protein [Bowmanella sp. JS7-9]|uniref:SapC family protein n=1 Tax=Pseudobowmanella zhangzhouensis TaxID=1537679 RepID=A0ABW1XNI1_9ALTE|nr:SapC family protein [Bowmanella sp. JS7-9]TBX23661.1 hypothetical protein TK45_06000 [Bowmanella sp. JS7-9]